MHLDVLLSILLIFSTASYLLLGLRLVASQRDNGSLPLGILFIVVSIWVMGGAIELMSSTFEVSRSAEPAISSAPRSYQLLPTFVFVSTRAWKQGRGQSYCY